MSLEKQLDSIEINALALRTMADTVLAEVGRLRNAARQPATPRKKEKINRQAALKTRLLTGKMKPGKK